jgi:DNA-binding response OmpR family regulator
VRPSPCCSKTWATASTPLWNGRDALAIQERTPADVVSDLMMPRVDGYELVETMRAKGNLTPVVLMSAVDILVCGLLGDVYLRKPVRPRPASGPRCQRAR